MTVLSETGWLLSKEIRREIRQRHIAGSILLYAAAMIFVAYMAFVKVTAPAWNALFWVILLFTTMHATAKSFMHESPGRQLYMYQLASPTAIILSKVLYNTLLIILLTLVSFGLYVLLIGNHAERLAFYLLTLVLSSIGFSGVFTLISAVSSKSSNGGMLMPVLSFPVLLPLILVGIKASKKAMDGLVSGTFYMDMIMLGMIDLIIILLAVILFRYLWKE